MAKRRKPRRASTSRLNVTAERVGAALGHFAARIDAWKSQREDIASELRRYVTSAQAMLEGLGSRAQAEGGKAVAAAKAAFDQATTPAAAPTPGRRRGYKQTAEARRKMRLAWKRRKAAKAAADAGKT